MTYPQGYCYAQWYFELGYTDDEILSKVLRLGPFPRVNVVLADIYKELENSNVYLSIPTRNAHLLHLDFSCSKEPIFELLRRMVGHVEYIGATAPCESYLAILAREGFDTASIARTVLDEAIRSNPSFKSGLTDALLDRVGRDLSAKKLDRLVIKYYLNSHQQHRLSNLYPEFDLTFPEKVQGHPHAFSAAARVCETQLALTKLGYRMSTKNIDIKDVGGNFATHILRNRSNIHCCTPILGSRDSHRFSTRLQILRNSSIKGGAQKAFTQSLIDETNLRKVFCTRKAQDCPVRADKMTFIHSTYDMSLADIADSMDSAHSSVAIIVMLFDPKCLVLDTGEIADQSCLWRVHTRNGEKRITFSFLNDSSCDYSHPYDQYISIVSATHVISTRGTLYTMEHLDSRAGSVYLQVNRNLCAYVPMETVSLKLWLGLEKLTEITYYDYTSHYSRKSTPGGKLNVEWIKRKLYVPTIMYNQAATHLSTLSAVKFSLESVMDYVRSLNARVTINGADVNPGPNISNTDFESFCCALFIHMYQRRFRSRDVVKEILKDEQEQRGKCDENLLTVAYKKLTRALGNAYRTSDSRFLSFTKRIQLWFDYDPLFDVSFNAAATFIEVLDHVPEYVNEALNCNEQLIDSLREVDQCIADSVHNVMRTVIAGRLDDWSADSVKDFQNSTEKLIPMALPMNPAPPPPDVQCSRMVKGKRTEKVLEDDIQSLNALTPSRVFAPTSPLCTHHWVCPAKTVGIIEVPGDGLCCFWVLMLAIGITEFTVQELNQFRETLRKSPHYQRFLDYDRSIEDELSAQNWGGDLTIQLFADHFSLDVCVHTIMEPQCRVFRSSTNAMNTVHLNHNGSHYNLINVGNQVVNYVHVCKKASNYMNLRGNDAPDTGAKIDGILAQTTLKGSMILLGGASKNGDTQVKMFTPYLRSRFTDIFSIDSRFAEGKHPEFEKRNLFDCDLTPYDVVISDVYSTSANRANYIEHLLEKTSPNASLLVKFTWSTINMILAQQLLMKVYWKVIRTSASGTSSEFFLLIDKKRDRPDYDVCFCQSVAFLWAHANECGRCRDVSSPKIVTTYANASHDCCIFMDCQETSKDVVVEPSESGESSSYSVSEILPTIMVRNRNELDINGSPEVVKDEEPSENLKEMLAVLANQSTLDTSDNISVVPSLLWDTEFGTINYDDEVIGALVPYIPRPIITRVPSLSDVSSISEKSNPTLPTLSTISGLSDDTTIASAATTTESDTPWHAAGNLIEKYKLYQTHFGALGDLAVDAVTDEQLRQDIGRVRTYEDRNREREQVMKLLLHFFDVTDYHYYQGFDRVVVAVYSIVGVKYAHSLLLLLAKNYFSIYLERKIFDVVDWVGQVRQFLRSTNSSAAEFQLPGDPFISAFVTGCFSMCDSPQIAHALVEILMRADSYLVITSICAIVLEKASSVSSDEEELFQAIVNFRLIEDDLAAACVRVITNEVCEPRDDTELDDCLPVEKKSVLRRVKCAFGDMYKKKVKREVEQYKPAPLETIIVRDNKKNVTTFKKYDSETVVERDSTQSVSAIKYMGLAEYAALSVVEKFVPLEFSYPRSDKTIQPVLEDSHDREVNELGKKRYDAQDSSEEEVISATKAPRIVNLEHPDFDEEDTILLGKAYTGGFKPRHTPLFVIYNKATEDYPKKLLINAYETSTGKSSYDLSPLIAHCSNRCRDSRFSVFFHQGVFYINFYYDRIKLVHHFSRFLDLFSKFSKEKYLMLTFDLEIIYKYHLCSNSFLIRAMLDNMMQYDSPAFHLRFNIIFECKTLQELLYPIQKRALKVKLKSPAHANEDMYDYWRREGYGTDFFQPHFVPLTNPNSYARNAMIEQSALWRAQDRIIMKLYFSTYKQLPQVLTQHAHDKLSMHTEDFGLFNVETGEYDHKPLHPKKKYMYGFDGVRFVNISKCKELEMANKRLLVGVSTELMNSDSLYSGTKKINVLTFLLPKIKFIEGVPGCGKTHYILTHLQPMDLVLFPTREGAKDFRRRYSKMQNDSDATELKQRFKTIHSFLINGSTISPFKRLIVDESLMLHAGEILFSIAKAEVEEVLLIGDSKQIPYINRTPQCEVKYAEPQRYADEIEYMSISRRCTNTVAALLSPLYDRGMKSTSNIRSEMELRKFTNLSAVPNVSGTKYLVFKQSEKTEMMKLGFDVSTVHEYQGKENPDIVVVRTSSKKEDIFNREEHCLVAISRHRKTFTYYSPDHSDTISKYIIKSKSLSDSDYRKAHYSEGGYIDNSRPIYKLRPNDGPYLSSEPLYSVTKRWGGGWQTGILVPEVDVAPMKMLMFDIPFIQQNAGLCDPSFLQEAYDWFFPGNSIHCLDFDVMNVNTTFPIDLHVENMTIGLCQFRNYKPSRFDKLRPALRTSVPFSRPSTQIETILAMLKRNLNVPDIQGDVDNETLASSMFEAFKSTYMNDSAYSFQSNPIFLNPRTTSEWLFTQKPGVINTITNDLPLHERKLNVYEFMIKSSVKPQLDVNAPFVYNSLQTIAYHPKDVNAIFCPIFKEIKKRILSCLRERFLIYCDMSPDDFADVLTNRYSEKGEYALFSGDDSLIRDSAGNYLEIDFSKYDKSQGEIALLYDLKLMEFFGVPLEYRELWANAHTVTVLNDRSNQVRLKVMYQRKSGDASTFIKNTTYAMGVIAVLFDLKGSFVLDRDRNRECASLFNLESKFFRSYRFPYFCSKFLISVDSRIFMVPDPMKLLTKLGRHDLMNHDHVEEYRVSLVDLVKVFSNAFLNQAISHALAERYMKPYRNLSYMLASMFNLVHNPQKFHELFYSGPRDILCEDPSRPSLDMDIGKIKRDRVMTHFTKVSNDVGPMQVCVYHVDPPHLPKNTAVRVTSDLDVLAGSRKAIVIIPTYLKYITHSETDDYKELHRIVAKLTQGSKLSAKLSELTTKQKPITENVQELSSKGNKFTSKIANSSSVQKMRELSTRIPGTPRIVSTIYSDLPLDRIPQMKLLNQLWFDSSD